MHFYVHFFFFVNIVVYQNITKKKKQNSIHIHFEHLPRGQVTRLAFMKSKNMSNECHNIYIKIKEDECLFFFSCLEMISRRMVKEAPMYLCTKKKKKIMYETVDDSKSSLFHVHMQEMVVTKLNA